MAEIKERVKKNGKISFTACIRIKGCKPMYKTFSRITDAKAWAGEIEPQLKRGKVFPEYEANKKTLAEVIDRYIKIELPKRKESEQAKIKMQLEWWKKQIGYSLLSNVTPALLSECKEILITEPSTKPQKGRKTRTGATANRYIAALSAVLTRASGEWGLIEENPLKKVRKFTEEPTKDRFLSPEEITRLLDACKVFELKGEPYRAETYLFVLIALSTGARYSEISGLRWQNVDLKNRQFYFMRTKNKENKGIPMTEKVYKELLTFQKIRNIKSDYLFTTKDGTTLIDMRTRFYKVLEVAEIENCRFHDLRHTVASHIAMNGGSLLDIASITGHKTMQMVKRYAHLTQKHTAELLEKTTQEMFSSVN